MLGAKLVPELYVTDISCSVAFYTRVIGFRVLYDRPEERFVYLHLGGAELMLEQTTDPARTFVVGELSYPFGRGMNLSINVPDVQAVYGRVQAQHPDFLFLALEERWYRRDDHMVGNRQFVTRDPDGYLLRLVQDLGQRDPTEI